MRRSSWRTPTTQNWHPGLIFSEGPVYANQFISHAGGPAATNGIQIGQVYALYLGQDAKTIPAVKQFNTYVKQVNSSWVPDLYTLYGWMSAQLFVQALKAAGPNPTRGAVIAQLKKVDQLQRQRTPGGLGPRSQDGDALLRHDGDQERAIRPRAAEVDRVRLQRQVLRRVRHHRLRVAVGCRSSGGREVNR